MKRIKIDPREYPKQIGESWWVVHPNTGGSEFRLPAGAVTVCTKDFLDDAFKRNVAYDVISADNHNGWITVESKGDLYDMPQYLFARYFDAESFVVGSATAIEMEKAVAFDYRPTVPLRPGRVSAPVGIGEQLEFFKG